MNLYIGPFKRLPIRELEFRSSAAADTRNPPPRDSFFWDLKFQLSIIEADMAKAFPSLQRVSFHEYVVWEGKSGEIPWRAFVPHAHARLTARHLNELGRSFTDHNDCFASILRQ